MMIDAAILQWAPSGSFGQGRKFAEVDLVMNFSLLSLRQALCFTFKKYRLDGEDGAVHPTNTIARQINTAADNNSAPIEKHQ